MSWYRCFQYLRKNSPDTAKIINDIICDRLSGKSREEAFERAFGHDLAEYILADDEIFSQISKITIDEEAEEMNSVDASRLFTVDTSDLTLRYIKFSMNKFAKPRSGGFANYKHICFYGEQSIVECFLKDRFDVDLPIYEAGRLPYISIVASDDGLFDEITLQFKLANIPHVTVLDRNQEFFYPRTLERWSKGYFLCDKHKKGYRYRPDLKEIYKSTWEANLARIFRYKGIEYKYEALSIPRQDFSTDSSYYFPDFLLSENRIVEVKGVWNLDSRKKAQEILKNYINYEYIVIDADIYYHLDKKYSSVIPFWEKSDIGCFYTLDVPVVGIGYDNRMQVVKSLKIWQEVILSRDPKNQYDSNAIAVATKDYREVGYISADWAAVIAPKMDAGVRYEGEIKTVQRTKVMITIRRTNTDAEIIPDFLR